MQTSVLLKLCILDAVIRVAEETIDVHKVVVRLLVAVGNVMLVEYLLSKDREQQADASAHGKGKHRVNHVILGHDQMLFLGVMMNAMSFGMMSAAARQRMSCSFSVALALVAVSVTALVTTRAVVWLALMAQGINSRMFLRKLRAVIVLS